MPRLAFNECSKYTTPSGKKVIVLNMTPEFYTRISNCAEKKSLSRQAYIISAINEALERDEDKQRQIQAIQGG